MGHSYIENNYTGHDSIGHNYMDHNYIGHDSIRHNYIAHDYSGHNYIGVLVEAQLAAIDHIGIHGP